MQEIRLNLFNYIFLLVVNALFVIIQTVFQEKNCNLHIPNNDKFIR